MSNHEHPCRGCGEDLRRLGEHEANCLALKLGAYESHIAQARRDLAQALDALDRDAVDDMPRYVRNRIYEAAKQLANLNSATIYGRAGREV